ncbi:MAG: adenylyl-sulfate kinase [Rhodobacterales bacterium]|nr:adenylyl-sulfate kinase [Rhodobacterales bacterium]
MSIKSTNITAVAHRVPQEERWRAAGHRGGVLWFTGLSGSGKSTLAFELEHRLFAKRYNVYVLDGDNVRHGLNSDLGFSPKDRAENIRRIGEVAALFAEAGVIVLSAFISPYQRDRDMARKAAGAQFHEIYLSADVSACEQRDPKGLYKKAREGKIPDFTGISAPYEAPAAAELVVDTANESIEACVEKLMAYVDEKFGFTQG